ncbi:MAG: site-specific DNA-methyltransferase [Deltaproteobacteria bacterium]|nr:site-specific DNA-methyltransferase [Deltaproteobacteria bacterium]
MWAGIPVYSNSTKYPTEKSEQLLAQIIEFVTSPGDLVMDVFAGSGTTAAVAEKLGRRWIVCDFGKHAVYVMQKRMCLIADSQRLGNQGKKKEKYGKSPKPFCVVSVGAFDFAKIMKLRENRDAYIAFVLGIFGITERDDGLAAKYRISNVCALKDGHPVEVYPVWEDDFLKNVRVDDEYLKGIMEQAGGKLEGIYYIVAPETCVRVGETVRKNGKGKKVTFRMLTFPYKVLEEAARNFTIEEQPSSPENINKLISSVGFYFNEEVEIKVRKNARGFRIEKFGTSILDRQERRYEGLEGLAMILVDSEYDEERGFTVDSVIYQKDIKGEDVVAGGITGKTAIIAIDKFGNESEVTRVK